VAVGKLGLTCPVYATVPVYKMGQMFLYDIYQARHNIEDFTLFTLDDVDATFEKITQLKYNQTVMLKGKGQGLAITPLPAGHMIGGTIWKIVKDGEEDIVYAVDYNHKKERHLNGCDIERLSRPSLLITDAFNATYSQAKRRLRDEQLMTNILATLRNSGNVLVCVDTAGRVLELAHMVDQLWSNKDSGLLAYSLALLNNVAFNVVEFAKSQIEWMSEKLMKMMGEKKANPFQFKHLKLCHSMAEVNKVPAPKVVLASMPDMECGFARDLFLQWCSNPKNSVILTSRPSPGTLGRDLIVNGGDRTIPIEVRRRIKLTGQELEQFRAKEKSSSSKLHSSLVEEALDDESDSDTEMEVVTKAGEPKPKVKHDIVMKAETGKKQTGFFKSNKSRYPMFPCIEEKIKYDDYGEIIRIEDFLMDTTEPVDEVAEAVEEYEEDVPDKEEVPTKCVSTTQNFQINCGIQFIDFEGRTDGESIMKLTAQLKPRRIILVRGTEDNLSALKDFCGDVIGGENNIFVPKNGEVVDATTERFIYQVRLRDSLFSTLNFNKAKDGHLAWVDGVIKMTDDEKVDIIATEGEEEEEAEPKAPAQPVIPVLVPIPEDQIVGHNTNFVNELKLSDFKLVLTKNGIPSEFQQGNLMCGHSYNVQLRRHDSGRVMIEGCLSNEYYTIRELLYQQYAIV
jgi:cleavage and polyadenylation specificity factor subunit 2